MAQHDVAGALFTSMHRHKKIEGRQEAKPPEVEGTGSVRAAARSSANAPPARRGGLYVAAFAVERDKRAFRVQPQAAGAAAAGHHSRNAG
jgi:hypothetical protein